MFTKNKFAHMDSIANLINTILEADTKAKMEELKGGQHKIDKNKNNKIDAQDFAILRGQKTAMKKEESEQVDEMSHQAKTTMKHIPKPTAGEKKAAKDIKPGVAGYRDRIAMLRSAEARGGLKKEEAEGVAEGISGKKKPKADRFHITGSLASYPDKESAIKDRDAKYPGAKVHQVSPRGKIKGEFKEGVAEEFEQFDEAKEPGYRSSYGLGKKGTSTAKPEKYGKRVTGKGYDKPENERKAPEGHASMTSLMPGHDERAAKFLARQAKGTLVKGKAQSAKQMEKEEIDPKNTTTDTLKGREKSSTNPNLSKKVMMDVPGNVKEGKEQVEEKAKWRSSSAAETHPMHDPDVAAHDRTATTSPIRSKADKPLPPGSLMSRRKSDVATSGSRAGMITKKSADSLKNRIKTNLKKEEAEQVDERTLTGPETAEKERIVKGMKKSLAGFKSRYGDRAKSVMYATATKAAKERK